MFWVLVLAFILAYLYFRIVNKLSYWTEKCVSQKTATNQLQNMASILLQTKSQAEIFQSMYNQYPGERYSGTYSTFTPVLLLRDPDLIKQITVKDFDHFTDHSLFIPEGMEPLWAKNLFSLKGDKWRDMRATLSPSFTSSKMKAMFHLMNECAQKFVDHFKKNNPAEGIEFKDVFTRFANDVIASTAFGITCDSLRDQNNEFYLMGKQATNLGGFLNGVKFFIILVFPKLAMLMRLKIFSVKASEFFKKIVKSNIESREKNGIVRHDMIHLLMEAKNGRLKHEDHTETQNTDGFAVIEESSVGKDEKRQKRQLTDDDLTAQVLVFFFAGFESVSTLMCFLIYEIAVNTEVQDRLREEVQQTLQSCGGSLTYDGLVKMKYLDMVLSEALRKWPAQMVVDRVCTKSYTIQPVKDGQPELALQKGDHVWLPIFAIQRDPQFYPNPELFDPERFSDENKSNINPYAYIPFGAGPRSCIGTRFALLETKTILFNIISNFEIVLTEKTTVPLELAKNTFTLHAKGGFWFKLKPLSV